MALVAHMLERGGEGALPFLIVVPASLVANWRAELSRWLPTVPFIAYTGPAEERERIYYRQVRKTGSTYIGHNGFRLYMVAHLAPASNPLCRYAKRTWAGKSW